MTRPLDLVFMGTPGFAATILAALIDSEHRIAAVPGALEGGEESGPGGQVDCHQVRHGR